MRVPSVPQSRYEQAMNARRRLQASLWSEVQGSWEKISIGTWVLPRNRPATHDHGLGLQVGSGLWPAARGSFNRVSHYDWLGMKFTPRTQGNLLGTSCPKITSNTRYQP